MKAILVTVAALGCVTFAGLSAIADPGPDPSDDLVVPATDSSDGGSLPGFPGGRGGKSGRELARESAGRYSETVANDQRLVDYCIEFLRSNGRTRGNSDMRPSDCMELFVALDMGRPGGRYGQAGESGQSGRRGGDGPDGASIDGGQGGQGGRAGGGPGGGAGGGGGKGVAGGQGGRGGAGGGGY